MSSYMDLMFNKKNKITIQNNFRYDIEVDLIILSLQSVMAAFFVRISIVSKPMSIHSMFPSPVLV